MNGLKQNRAFAILLCILSISAIVFGFTYKEQINTNTVQVLKGEQTTGLNLESVQIQKESAVPEFNYIPAKGVAAVLGCSTTGVCDYTKEFKYQPVCVQSSAEVVVGDGTAVGNTGSSVKVNDNSIIEIAEITVPIALLSGSPYVKDDRMAIMDSENGFQGTFKPSAEMITEDEVLRYQAPGEMTAEVRALKNNAKTGNFAVNVNVKTGEQDSSSNEPNKAVVAKELASSCPKVQKSDPNPDFSNKAASRYLVPMMQAPGDHAYARDYGGKTCVQARNAADQLTGSEKFPSCVSNLVPFNFLVTAQVAIKNWLECTEGTEEDPAEPDKCTKSVLYALEIDAIFGSPYKENKAENTAMYYDYLTQTSASPGEAQLLAPESIQPNLVSNSPAVKPFYITTPCKVRVDGKGIYKIPCLWDVSPYKAEYLRQKKDAGPGSKDLPTTFEEYWTYVDYEASQRYLSCQ